MSQVRSINDSTENRRINPESDRQTRFTDWNGGRAIAHKPENRRDEILLERPTMEMGNKTLFYPEEGEPPSRSVLIGGKSFYERLDDHNRDCWWKYRDEVKILRGIDRESKRHLISVFAGEVAMNQHQKQRAFRELMRYNLSSFGLPVELVAFVVCVLVSNSDAKESGGDKLYHPQRSASNNDPHFQRLAENLISAFPRITKNSITSMFNKLTQGTPQTRHPKEWNSFVRRRSFIPPFPSYASEAYEPGEDPISTM